MVLWSKIDRLAGNFYLFLMTIFYPTVQKISNNNSGTARHIFRDSTFLETELSHGPCKDIQRIYVIGHLESLNP